MLVAVVSLKGSPGVSTFALALAARWPAGRSVLVEADPSGGDLATRFSLPATPGLVSLAAAARRSRDPDLLWQHAQALPGGLAVVAAPPDADRAHAALSTLTGHSGQAGVGVVRAAADAPGTAVILDGGRTDPHGVAVPLVRSADVLVVLSRAHADALAHLVLRLPQVGRWCRRPVLLLVGAGHATDEVARELGVPPLGRIPEDPRGAAVLCGRPGSVRRSGPTHSPLGRFAHQVAQVLAAPFPPAQATRPPVLRVVPPPPAAPSQPPDTEITTGGGEAS